MIDRAESVPLRLLQVNTSRGWRGGESQTLLLCEGLAARGHEVLLAAAPGDALHRRAAAAGIATRGLRVRGDGDLFGTIGLARIAAGFQPDLVHLHTSRAHAAGWVASLLLPPAPLVVSRRVDFAPGRSALARLKYASRIDRFVAVSDGVSRILVASGIAPERVRTVYDGVPPRTAPDPLRRVALRAALGIPEAAPLIGNVGALASHKDPITLVTAAARVLETVRDARFLIVGEGPLRRAVEAEIARLAIGGRTILAGFRDDPIDCLALLDVFVVTSRQEGLNSTLLDAMALGLPIVATRAGGIPEIIGDGDTGLLVEPGDAESAARAILDLLGDRARARRLGDEARRAAARFTDERMVRETEAVYTEVIAERAAARKGSASAVFRDGKTGAHG